MGINRRGGGMAAGTLAPFAGGTIPEGWLECAGQAVSRAAYAGLFLAIGTQYGAGDGATTFNVPDLRGRAIFGKDNMNGGAANRLTSGVGGVDGATLGAVGGGQSVTLTTSEMPGHRHEGAAEKQVGNISAGGTQITTASSYQGGTIAWNPVSSGTNNALRVASQGSGGAHANVPPALVANYIIKT